MCLQSEEYEGTLSWGRGTGQAVRDPVHSAQEFELYTESKGVVDSVVILRFNNKYRVFVLLKCSIEV